MQGEAGRREWQGNVVGRVAKQSVRDEGVWREAGRREQQGNVVGRVAKQSVGDEEVGRE